MTERTAAGALVTIGIPTYNRADGTLAETVRAALAQTYANVEVIVSDNCSTDRTPDLMQSLAHERLRYYRNEHNLGANGNFNALLDRANGEFVLLLSDDDLIDPDLVSVCMRAVDSPDVGLVKAGQRIIGADGVTLREVPNAIEEPTVEAFYRAWFTGKMSIYLCSVLFRTSLLKATGGLRSRYNLVEDCMAIARILEAHGYRFVPETLASFREHPEQRTGTASLMRWSEEFGGLLVYLARQQRPVSPECLELGRRFFARLIRGWGRRIPNPLARRVARWRTARYFRQLDLS